MEWMGFIFFISTSIRPYNIPKIEFEIIPIPIIHITKGKTMLSHKVIVDKATSTCTSEMGTSLHCITHLCNAYGLTPLKQRCYNIVPELQLKLPFFSEPTRLRQGAGGPFTTTR